jgi:hypothetical protein
MLGFSASGGPTLRKSSACREMISEGETQQIKSGFRASTIKQKKPLTRERNQFHLSLRVHEEIIF